MAAKKVKKKPTLWIITMEGCTDPEVLNKAPFKSEATRVKEAKAWVEKNGLDFNAIMRLDVLPNGRPVVRSFTGAELP